MTIVDVPKVSDDQWLIGVDGLASARVSTSGYVSNVVVSWWKRGEGIGTKLMRQVCRFADANKMVLWLDCRDDLISWYESLGFEWEDGEHKFIGNRMRRVPR